MIKKRKVIITTVGTVREMINFDPQVDYSWIILFSFSSSQFPDCFSGAYLIDFTSSLRCPARHHGTKGMAGGPDITNWRQEWMVRRAKKSRESDRHLLEGHLSVKGRIIRDKMLHTQTLSSISSSVGNFFHSVFSLNFRTVNIPPHASQRKS